jgi:hypothetical protein
VSGIEGLGGGGPVRGARRSGAALGRPGFSIPDDSNAAPRQAAAADGAAPVQLDAMLALQEMDAAGERDRAARRHGQTMLQVLAALQTALLAGDPAGDPATLNRLAGLLATMPDVTNPSLAGLLAAVRLRTRIELARRGHPAP